MKKIIILIALLMLIVSLSASFGKNKVQFDKIEWSVIRTLHFDIYFPKGADNFGRTVALMAEEAYYYLQDAFQYPVYDRIPIIFYESHREFQVTNIIYPLLFEGVGGFTEILKNRVVIPYDGSYKKLEETLIHELTHAYVNVLDSDLSSSRFFNIQRMSFPFWFSEGLPEYLAVGGEDNYNNMFVMDLILNTNLPPIDRVGGYYAYRLGESLLSYIDEQYGRESVMRLFYAIKTSGTMDAATEKVLGMSFDNLQKRWRNHLFRSYTPFVTTHHIPYEVYHKRTDSEKYGAPFNFAPRFAPDGNSFIYFSNRGQRMSVWRGLTIDIFEDNLVLRGETTGRFEQFHFLRSNLSWFPDSRHFAFVAKTKAGDVLYVADVQTGRITQSIEMFEFDAIYEIDISSSGRKVVFSGQRDMNNNIFYMDLETRETTQITNDLYYDHQPRWSPDESKIVFTSERSKIDETKYNHLFNSLTNQIYYYDLSEDQFYQITDDQFSNYGPIWDKSGTKVLFISEESRVANYHIIDLVSGERAIVTRTLTGVFKGDLNNDEKQLILSIFYENGWNIYVAHNPLENLDYYSYSQPQKVSLTDDFYNRFELYRYRYFGKRDDFFEKEDKETVIERRDTSFYRVRRNITLHQRPTEIFEPVIKPYRVRFFLDRLWGGVAYSSSYGTIGSLQLGFSDIMGDHTIGVQLGIAGRLKDSDILLSYMYLPRRIDYGFGGFYLNDDFMYIVYNPYLNRYEYINVLERDIGLYTLISYPFNRFWRLDFENVVYHRRDLYEIWDRNTGLWDKAKEIDGYIYSPQLKLVHDNILYGATGPMTGWRGFLTLNKSFAERFGDYFTARTDLRHYTLFAKNYTFATRAVLGSSTGENPQQFRIDGHHGIRGLSDSIRGRNKAVANLELRFPFIERMNMKFPLPMTLTQVRGSIYTDIGAVWNDPKQFKGSDDGTLKDLKFGFGMGPRINLGYFVLKFDTAWTTDFATTSKPTYYLSINEEF